MVRIVSNLLQLLTKKRNTCATSIIESSLFSCPANTSNSKVDYGGGGRAAALALRPGPADQPAAPADQYQPVASECAQAEQGEP